MNDLCNHPSLHRKAVCVCTAMAIAPAQMFPRESLIVRLHCLMEIHFGLSWGLLTVCLVLWLVVFPGPHVLFIALSQHSQISSSLGVIKIAKTTRINWNNRWIIHDCLRTYPAGWLEAGSVYTHQQQQRVRQPATSNTLVSTTSAASCFPQPQPQLTRVAPSHLSPPISHIKHVLA